ncbi:hypothetical protein [Hymenobacter yonginensis]|uniref:DUF3575 domain-containing protein n=1 Tax=Hymenobacter yonginensis TaxID=748197 RepID=A0ABY7PPB8_9BACT|nr:hypothetical protein [Hymenobacter yonginensis]WBO85078.1 hypothetical protein O9Z63_02290 [Hymenobacter yonginensis]
MPAFYALALSAATLLSAPDTILATTPPQQIIKLGIQGFGPGFYALTYERQLSTQWSVIGSVGYFGYSQRSGTIFYDYDGSIVEDNYTTRERFYNTNVQLRRYFRRHKIRPLAGWFAAANLHTYLRNSREQHSRYTNLNYNRSRTTAQVQFLLGRQSSLGRRLTLDSYLGLNLRRRQSASLNSTGGVWLEGGVGLQVGYRFQPLARR